MKRKLKYILILITFSLIVCDAGTLNAVNPNMDGVLCKGGCLPDVTLPCINENCLGQRNAGCTLCDSPSLSPYLKGYSGNFGITASKPTD